jgi:AcrR family transcriptional regulator
MNTQAKILKKTSEVFSRIGYEGLNMRLIAKEADIVPSVIYHYFENKDDLLKAMFFQTSKDLGRKRKKLAPTASAQEMLSQRIEFQLDHAQEVVAILKFYLHYRKQFDKLSSGFVPESAYLHIREVLEKGMETGEFTKLDLDKDAKVITHAINGFLLEYYPSIPKDDEKRDLIKAIATFILRSIKNPLYN